MASMKLPADITGDIPVETVTRLKLDGRDWVGKQVKEGQYSRLIDSPIILQEGGGGAGGMQDGLLPRTTIILLDLKKYGVDLSHLVEHLLRIKYSSLNRVSGHAAIGAPRQRVFGYMPRKTGHRDYCTVSSLAWDDDKAHGALEDGAQTAEHFYRMLNPVLYDAHMQQVDNEVQARYHLNNGVFTSGIVNKDNPLPYHYDTGNFAAVWSAMYVFKSPGYSGGRLHVPEYDCAFDLPDHSLLMFDGQGLVHGVTPVVNEGGAYRYSVVYYSLRMMWQCLTTWEEVSRARKIKTAREQLRAVEDQARAEPNVSKRNVLLRSIETLRAELKKLDGVSPEDQMGGDARQGAFSTLDERGEDLW